MQQGYDALTASSTTVPAATFPVATMCCAELLASAEFKACMLSPQTRHVAVSALAHSTLTSLTLLAHSATPCGRGVLQQRWGRHLCRVATLCSDSLAAPDVHVDDADGYVLDQLQWTEHDCGLMGSVVAPEGVSAWQQLFMSPQWIMRCVDTTARGSGVGAVVSGAVLRTCLRRVVVDREAATLHVVAPCSIRHTSSTDGATAGSTESASAGGSQEVVDELVSLVPRLVRRLCTHPDGSYHQELASDADDGVWTPVGAAVALLAVMEALSGSTVVRNHVSVTFHQHAAAFMFGADADAHAADADIDASVDVGAGTGANTAVTVGGAGEDACEDDNLEEGDRVWHAVALGEARSVQIAVVVGVHRDATPWYYTIELMDGSRKGTERSRLFRERGHALAAEAARAGVGADEGAGTGTGAGAAEGAGADAAEGACEEVEGDEVSQQTPELVARLQAVLSDIVPALAELVCETLMLAAPVSTDDARVRATRELLVARLAALVSLLHPGVVMCPAKDDTRAGYSCDGDGDGDGDGAGGAVAQLLAIIPRWITRHLRVHDSGSFAVCHDDVVPPAPSAEMARLMLQVGSVGAAVCRQFMAGSTFHTDAAARSAVLRASWIALASVVRRVAGNVDDRGSPHAAAEVVHATTAVQALQSLPSDAAAFQHLDDAAASAASTPPSTDAPPATAVRSPLAVSAALALAVASRVPPAWAGQAGGSGKGGGGGDVAAAAVAALAGAMTSAGCRASPTVALGLMPWLRSPNAHVRARLGGLLSAAAAAAADQTDAPHSSDHDEAVRGAGTGAGAGAGAGASAGAGARVDADAVGAGGVKAAVAQDHASVAALEAAGTEHRGARCVPVALRRCMGEWYTVFQGLLAADDAGTDKGGRPKLRVMAATLPGDFHEQQPRVEAALRGWMAFMSLINSTSGTQRADLGMYSSATGCV